MVYVVVGLVVALVGFLAWVVMSPELKYHSFLYKVKSKIIFFLGDIRGTKALPKVTMEVREDFGVDFSDIRRGDSLSRPGDIGLHRIRLQLSNLGIPGAFKHAWIVTDENKCVEATSEGVIERDAIYPLATDYAVILRPKDITPDEVATALRRAKAIVGCEYDANFKFDLDEADAAIGVRDMSQYARNLKAGAFHGAFSCTEVVGFSWLHCREKLRLFRTNFAGRDAIVADDFLKMGFDVVWASPNLTDEWMRSGGLHEEGRRKVTEWLRDNPR